MENDKDIAGIYDLIEQFDFEELPENDKSFVLQHISETEYTHMRSTVSDTRKLFSKYPDRGKKDHSSLLKKIVFYPIELYKIAAVIILFFGIGYPVSKFISSGQNELLAVVDTVYIKKTDTVVIEKAGMIEAVKTRIEYQDKTITENPIPQSDYRIENADVQTDCSKNLCPDDVIMLSKIKTKGNFSNDTMLIEFMVELN